VSMSTVPHRAPDTPLNTYYMTGKYEKALPEAQRFVKLSAFPGVAAPMNDRNKSQNVEVNVKPIT
jgi:hypothetical protein